jgi:hypothetical protein
MSTLALTVGSTGLSTLGALTAVSISTAGVVTSAGVSTATLTATSTVIGSGAYW